MNGRPPPTRATTLLDAVRRAVADVPDPELPPVTLGMLGMVHDVAVDDGRVRVELLPTFAGLPRHRDDRARRRRGGRARARASPRSRVRFRFDPPWTPDRIDAVGRERLREFGIAPPGGATGAPTAGRPRDAAAACSAPASDPRPCPYCGSSDTVRESNFGPTPCRDVRFCEGCQQPFEAFKP